MAARVLPVLKPVCLGVPDSGMPGYRRLPSAQEEVQGREVRYVLLSPHEFFNPLNPMYSYLLIAPSDQDDERITAEDKTGLYRHPHFWAVFQLVGDWR